MFKKRRAAKEVALATEADAYADRAQKIEEQLTEECAAAEKLHDIGEKYLALQAVGKKISDIKLEEKQASPELKSLGWKYAEPALGLLWVAGMVGGAVLVIASPVAAPVIAFSVAGAAFAGGMVGEVILGMKIDKRIEWGNNLKKGFYDRLETVEKKISGRVGDLVQNSIDQLALSPKFDELYDGCEDVRKAFVKASARGRVQDQAPQALDKPRADRTGLKLN